MPDCEVCVQNFGHYTVTFSGPAGRWHVQFCQDCLTAVLQTMADRWNQSIDEQNKAVGQLLTLLKIPADDG